MTEWWRAPEARHARGRRRRLQGLDAPPVDVDDGSIDREQRTSLLPNSRRISSWKGSVSSISLLPKPMRIGSASGSRTASSLLIDILHNIQRAWV